MPDWKWCWHADFWTDIDTECAGLTEAVGELLNYVEEIREVKKRGKRRHKQELSRRESVCCLTVHERIDLSIFFFYSDLGGATLVGLKVARAEDSTPAAHRGPDVRLPSDKLWADAAQRLQEIDPELLG